MSEDYPDARPEREDGTAIKQPFAFTTGRGGDFRPMVERIEKPVKGGEFPKDSPVALSESGRATGHADLQGVPPTGEQFENQMTLFSGDGADLMEPPPSLVRDQQQASEPDKAETESSASPAKPVPPVAPKATPPKPGNSSQTSS